jgi:Glycosyl hydrolase catalytic core
MRKCGAFVVMLSLAGFITFASSSDQEELRPPSGPIPAQLFGMHIHHLFQGAPENTPWPSVPFAVWRLWGTYTYWSRLEPVKGRWDFSLLDKYVGLAEQHHVEALLTLGITPQWSSSRPDEKSDFGAGGSATPNTMADWQEYVRLVGTRYKGRVHEYEIWNEPNLTNTYTGSIQGMVDLARIAYQTLKQIDPTVIVCSPSPTGVYGGKWLDEYLKAGGGRYADVIGYHFYVAPEPPEDMVPMIQNVEQVMAHDGVGNKPLWDTETGWTIQDRNGSVKPRHGIYSVVLSPSQASAYVVRAYVLAWGSGVSRFYWYDWDGDMMGLVEPDGKTLKPAAVAYEEVENWLVGASMSACGAHPGGIWVCALARPNNFWARIVWKPDGKGTFLIPADWKVREIRDLNGGKYTPAANRIVGIGPSPILLVSPGG